MGLADFVTWVWRTLWGIFEKAHQVGSGGVAFAAREKLGCGFWWWGGHGLYEFNLTLAFGCKKIRQTAVALLCLIFVAYSWLCCGFLAFISPASNA